MNIMIGVGAAAVVLGILWLMWDSFFLMLNGVCS